MSRVDLGIFFWTDSKGVKHVGYGKAKWVTPYDLTAATSANGPNSIKDHSRGGKLSPGRYSVHNQIIREMFNGHEPFKDGEEKVVYFTGGGSASGKGTFSKDIAKYYKNDNNPIIIDPDKIKSLLLKADTGNTRLDASTGSYYHLESSMLANRLYEIALQHNYPVLFDSTGTGSRFGNTLSFAKTCGYKTKLRFMCADVNSILDGSLSRYKSEGRLVPLHRLLATHQIAQAKIPQLFSAADDVELYRRQGSTISLVAKGGTGKTLHKVDSDLWDAFMDQTAYTLTPSAVAKYNQAVAAIKSGH